MKAPGAARALATAAALLALSLLGCSVATEGAACEDDLHCPAAQRCTREGACVEGARAAVHLEDSCLSLLDALARKAQSCLGGDAQALFRLVQAEELCGSVGAGVEAGRQEFLPAEHGQCLRDVRALPCGEVTLEALTQGRLLTRACGAFRPRTAEGQACTSTSDCQEGWCSTARQTCNASGQCTTAVACPGVCKRFAALQAPCSDLEQCQPGASCVSGRCQSYAGEGGSCFGPQCDPRSDTFCGPGSTCTRRKGAGAACAAAAECAQGLACVREAPGSDVRTCQPALALGAACTPGRGQCEATLHCDTTRLRCEVWPSLGGTCNVSPLNPGEPVYCVGSRCPVSFFNVPQTCVPFAGAGEACASALDCSPLSACRGGLCAPAWCR
jgi:hypothetical protein